MTREIAGCEVAGCAVGISSEGVLRVMTPEGVSISVLPVGTHAALDVLGENKKEELVRWWQERRRS
jgi:hypothetical protein